MKKAVMTAIAMTCAVSVFAQGTVNFNNRNGFTTHVYGGGFVPVHGAGPTDNYGTNVVAPGNFAGNLLIGTVGSQFAAGTTFASLLGAPGLLLNDSTMLPGALGTAFGGGFATTFRTGAAAGNIVGATATFNNIPKDAAVATFEMVVWDNSSGLYPTWALASQSSTIFLGKSALFQFTVPVGGDINTPPGWGDIKPSQAGSFNIYYIPEPATAALAGLGAAALLIFRRRRQ